MSRERVAVTGANGTIGRAILEELNEHGYHTVGVARGKRREDVSDEYVTTDLLEPGEVYGAFAKTDVDAVVHMGTIPGPGSHQGYRVYESNAQSSYHVLESAESLGIESVVLPSSVNVVGTVMQEEPPDVRYLPWDENHPVTPREPYGLGKHSLEVTADGFGRREGAPTTISSLRYPGVNDEASLREDYVEGDAAEANLENPYQRDDLFTYLHLRDAASIARAAVEADFEGHERFWAVADDTTVALPSTALADRFWPEVERTRELVGHESLVDNGKAADLLDWEPVRSWRDL